MGAIAQRLADAVVVTSDNPRSEPPEAILAQIVAGMAAASASSPAPLCIADRAEAIHHTIAHAQPADVVLIAGKGHETTQEVAGVKQPFSDVDVASLSLSARRSA
jgi:UDP-N-acetylmuramoyl-L-alanyl-D-glutamate--2,6-diaminopimelate ligase